jgi:hypothetical protein
MKCFPYGIIIQQFVYRLAYEKSRLDGNAWQLGKPKDANDSPGLTSNNPEHRPTRQRKMCRTDVHKTSYTLSAIRIEKYTDLRIADSSQLQRHDGNLDLDFNKQHNPAMSPEIS